jgi:hypothetical protein
MISFYACLLLLLLLDPYQAWAQSTTPVDSARVLSGHSPRSYSTRRLDGERPVIDGLLDDTCWRLGTWAGDFTQWIPREGAKPSQPTEMKILYDEENIYVAIRAIETEPGLMTLKGARRDQFAGDMVGVCFDSYHDHRTGFEFDVTSSGQKVDLILTNPSTTDVNWNAVWEVKTALQDSAWTAEFEIPLSQLRFSSDEEQVWGLHCWRWIDRLQEESDWEPQSSTGPGILYLFGELHGLRGLPASRRIEALPYALGKVKSFDPAPANPFAANGRQWDANAGVDLKIGLTSNFTADVTVNPDFGQVELDPSVMNLTAFETFFEEKRPFFLEGKNIFSFNFDNVNMFYSRRIGHGPSYVPTVQSGQHLDFPDQSTILGALKVSGKTSEGLALGVLQSVTAEERAVVADGFSSREVTAEPATSFSLVRVQQDFDEGSSTLGGMVTATNRFIHDAHLAFLNRSAYTGGIDVLHQWSDKEFYLSAKVVGSTISGSPEAIATLQRSPARYFQRPDAGHIDFDSTRTRLSGFGGQVKIGKGSKGLWRYSSQLDWRSPGFDVNDLGYMQTTDIIKLTNAVSYFVNQPAGIFRTYSVGLVGSSQGDFGMRYLSTSIEGEFACELHNNWAVAAAVAYTPEGLDTRLLRGGPAVRMPSVVTIGSQFKTDPSRRIVFDVHHESSTSGDGSAHVWSIEPSLSIMPSSDMKVAFGAEYSSGADELQFVTAQATDGNMEYILAHIERQSIGAIFRIDWSLTNTLSLQYYGSPFGSVGSYTRFKAVRDTRSDVYANRFAVLDARSKGNAYEVYRDNGSAPFLLFDNPDFSFAQFRSVLVLRWEYLPGSQLYLVWTQERTRYDQPGDDSVVEAMRTLTKVSATDLFLMKISYWFSM